MALYMYVDVRKTYKFRLYRNDKRDGHLHQQINVAGLIWNHALALQCRYYRLTGKYIPLGRLKAADQHPTRRGIGAYCQRRSQAIFG